MAGGADHCGASEWNASSARRSRRPGRSLCWLLVGTALAAVVGVRPAVAQDSAGTGGAAPAATDPVYIPDVSRLLPQASDKQSLSSTLQILILLTLLAVAPSILLMMTSFVRMVIVLVLLRQALGTQQLPPSQVLVGLALFMTILVMAPTWQRIRQEAVDPYLNDEMTQLEAISTAGQHLRDYMFLQIENSGNEQDVYLMYEYAAQRPVAEAEVLTREQVPMTALVPAFLLSELKTAFVLGFRIYLPFLVIDMVIATVLVSMGMMMLPPVLISLPFKLLLFVLADGWHLIGGSLMASVQ
jgi:flagellar biosynthetic protein FliP